MIEKRKAQRVRMDCPVQVREVTYVPCELLRNSFCRNISQLGLEIVSFCPYQVTGQVHVRILSDDYISLLEAIGQVVWVHRFPFQNKYRVGIKFLYNRKIFYQKLKTLIRDTRIKCIFSSKGDRNAE